MSSLKRKTIIRTVPGIIIGSFMIGIIIWSVSTDKKCEKLIKKDNCLKQIVFSYYSKEHMLGNGSRAISTGFYINQDGKTYKATTKNLIKRLPNRTPILIRYSPECPNCYEFLWDSVIVHNNLKYEYFYVEEKGYDLRLTIIQ